MNKGLTSSRSDQVLSASAAQRERRDGEIWQAEATAASSSGRSFARCVGTDVETARRRRSRNSNEARDVDFLRAQGRLETGCVEEPRNLQAPCAGKSLQRLAQHLAPLPERGMGRGGEQARIAGVGRGARDEFDYAETTFGGGVKAAGGTSNSMRAWVRQPASTASRS